MTSRTEQAEQDRQDRTGSIGQVELDRQNWAGRARQAKLDRQDRAARKGLPRGRQPGQTPCENRKVRTAGTGARTVHAEKDRQNKTAMTGLPGQDGQDRAAKWAARTGLRG
jgi:hypothetical protein